MVAASQPARGKLEPSTPLDDSLRLYSFEGPGLVECNSDTERCAGVRRGRADAAGLGNDFVTADGFGPFEVIFETQESLRYYRRVSM